MLKVRESTEYKVALTRLLEKCIATPVISVPLVESDGYVLAEDIIARHDNPPFDRARYDGYAIRSIDTKGATDNQKFSFRIVDHIGAGQISDISLGEYEAVRIMTGAQLPSNADAVIMFEHCELSNSRLIIARELSAQENVMVQGEDAIKGERLLEKGITIHAGIIALLATFGYTEVKVAKKPVVGILITGSELLNVADDLQPGKIRNSNELMLAAQLKRCGIRPRIYEFIHDDVASCVQNIQRIMTETDCLITTGGVSVGDYDVLPMVYDLIGAEVLFNKVGIRPGSVTTVAHLDNHLLIGLSGNPSSCFTAFELFVRPAIQKMMGKDKLFLPQMTATLLDEVIVGSDYTQFIQGILSFDGNEMTVKSVKSSGSNAISPIAQSNVLIILPNGIAEFRKGMTVTVIQLHILEGEIDVFL